MRFPVYSFAAILKELRRDAGLTVLGAAEATAYGNYERWRAARRAWARSTSGHWPSPSA